MDIPSVTATLQERLTSLTSGETIEAIARQARFVKRQWRKVDPSNLLQTFIHCLLNESMSYSTIASYLSERIHDTISKQDIAKRMNNACVLFLQCVLAYVMARQMGAAIEPIVTGFSRILVQDSVNIPLPALLAVFFPSGRNQTHKAFATAKIQAVYDLRREHFLRFHLSSYRDSDQTLGLTLLDVVQAGDLLIRDLGYFTLGALQQIQQCGAYFLSRYRPGCVLYDPETGKRISLLTLLRQKGTVDCAVLLGKQERFLVRLVALPVDEKTAAERRRKARQNRNRRYQPSKTYLALLRWNIYLLNVPPDRLSAQQADRLYHLRWRIETLFKVWKSEFHLRVPKQKISLTQAYAYILVALIVVTLFHRIVLPMILASSFGTGEESGKNPSFDELRWSIIKLARWYRRFFSALFFSSSFAFLPVDRHRVLAQCQYEHRKKRVNYHQQRCVVLG